MTLPYLSTLIRQKLTEMVRVTSAERLAPYLLPDDYIIFAVSVSTRGGRKGIVLDGGYVIQSTEEGIYIARKKLSLSDLSPPKARLVRYETIRATYIKKKTDARVTEVLQHLSL